jgi:hypothetical protein
MGLLHPLLATHGPHIWGLPRIFKQSLERLSGKSEWGSNRGSEGRQEGTKNPGFGHFLLPKTRR